MTFAAAKDKKKPLALFFEFPVTLLIEVSSRVKYGLCLEMLGLPRWPARSRSQLRLALVGTER